MGSYECPVRAHSDERRRDFLIRIHATAVARCERGGDVIPYLLYWYPA